MSDVLALVPARVGSKRIPGKNIRRLAGHPLIAYTIAAARESGVFDSVVVSTDGEDVAAVARHYGAEVPFLRPSALATDRSPDVEWLAFTLERLAAAGRAYRRFALLRPTSPFRRAETIRRAIERFAADPEADSLRAVELCAQHPAKMWFVEGDRMRPVLPGKTASGTPWHSSPYQALPPVYVQNASLEVATTALVLERGSLAGERILPFVSEGLDGFDINDERDWHEAERLVASGEGRLPPVAAAPWSGG